MGALDGRTVNVRSARPYPLLVEDERQDLRSLGGDWWLKSRKFTAVRERLWRVLDLLVEEQRGAGFPSPRDPRRLAAFASVFLRHEGSVADALGRRRNSDLTGDRWELLWDLLGRGAVERWMRQRVNNGDWPADEIEEEAERELVVARDFLSDLEALLELTRSQAAASTRESLHEGLPTTNLPVVGDLLAETMDRLQKTLEVERDLVRPAEDGDLPLDEQEREIEKAALLRLRLRDLHDLARELGVPLVRNGELLADLIVRESRITRAEIAEFVLRRERAGPEHGLITRLLPLRQAPELHVTSERLQAELGSWARLRVARWFLFDDLASTSGRIRLSGRVRHFRASPVLDVGDYKVNATPITEEVRVVLRRNQPWAEASARTVAAAEDIRSVLSRAGAVATSDHLALPVPPLLGPYGLWDPWTVWMLGFLEQRLPDQHVGITDFRMAQFDTVPGDQPPAASRPQIARVRLQGQHIGSHREACQLIVDGRRLHELELLVHFAPNVREFHQIVIRIAVDDQLATIMTSASEAPGPAVAALHESLVGKLRTGLEHGVDVAALAPLFERITARARQSEPAPATADLFAPEFEPLLEADGATQ